ncbi:MAG: VWA domain-containing protein, partial [Alphaproteobacteria bacterium]|nr:VWA domain-containing protein [Alphaproteobacteria bacterium]
MTANGNTNQTVGLAWGWQTLSDSDPFNPGAVPEDTRRVVILLTDGENTQNRWTNTASTIDARTSAACTNIKNDHITLYSVQVDTSTNPQQSSMLQSCASDPSKYFMLT